MNKGNGMQKETRHPLGRRMFMAVTALMLAALPVANASADDPPKETAQSTEVDHQQSTGPQADALPDMKSPKGPSRLGARSVAGSITGPWPSFSYLGTTLTASYKWILPTGESLPLAGFDLPDGSNRQWCVNALQEVPVAPNEAPRKAVRGLVQDVDPQLRIENDAQMAYILRNWGGGSGPVELSAVAALVHLNYQVDEGVGVMSHLDDTLRDGSNSAGQVLYQAAAGFVADAKRNAIPEGVRPGLTSHISEDKRSFLLRDINIRRTYDEDFMAGYDVVVTLEGPVAFDTQKIVEGTVSQDGKTWKGKTKTTSIELPGYSTGNGEFRANVVYPNAPTDELTYLIRPMGSQSTLVSNKGSGNAKKTTPWGQVANTFQPVLVSSVVDAGAKVLDQGANVLKDRLVVSAQEGDVWLGIGGIRPGHQGYEPLPVKFRGTAYYLGETPFTAPLRSASGGAVKVAEAEFVANGPGAYDVKADYRGDPGFITWVWQMNKEDQPQINPDDLQLIEGSWSDQFGLADETSVVRWKGKIESNLKVHPTNDNTFLVDDVWITGLPDTHGTFTDWAGFGSDVDSMEARLYFWENKTIDQIKSADDALLIGTVQMPAKNGFFASQGTPEWKLQRDSAGSPLLGTYQVVHMFEGDDRVAQFSGPIPDKYEMYEVTGSPKIGTTATSGGKKSVVAVGEVSVVDRVCYVGLTAGKEYQLRGLLMERRSGKPLLSDGKKIEAQTSFKPSSAEGCEDVTFKFDATDLGGKTVVVFEELFSDEVLVTAHADLEAKSQTIELLESKKPKEELAKTGANKAVAASTFGLSALFLGAGLLMGVKRRRR